MCRLKKSLYGLKQAPRQWYLKFDKFMSEQGYTRCHSDHHYLIKTTSSFSSRYSSHFHVLHSTKMYGCDVLWTVEGSKFPRHPKYASISLTMLCSHIWIMEVSDFCSLFIITKKLKKDIWILLSEINSSLLHCCTFLELSSTLSSKIYTVVAHLNEEDNPNFFSCKLSEICEVSTSLATENFKEIWPKLYLCGVGRGFYL